MLFCTSLVAVVGVGDLPSLSPRRLKIINTKVFLAMKTATRRHVLTLNFRENSTFAS